jgi:hypothetical protein
MTIIRWILFCLISLFVIYTIHGWISNILSRKRNTRDLVKTQTSKYKQILDEILNPPTTIPELGVEEDLLAFSKSLESGIVL